MRAARPRADNPASHVPRLCAWRRVTDASPSGNRAVTTVRYTFENEKEKQDGTNVVARSLERCGGLGFRGNGCLGNHCRLRRIVTWNSAGGGKPPTSATVAMDPEAATAPSAHVNAGSPRVADRKVTAMLERSDPVRCPAAVTTVREALDSPVQARWSVRATECSRPRHLRAALFGYR